MKVRKILVMNGPNLDMLGEREPEVYGDTTLTDLEQMVELYTAQQGALASFYQSNSEAKLIKRIHNAPRKYAGIVFNPGAHTHYSYALRDAIAAVDVPVVEVHLSDIDDREPFRKCSVIAPACVAQVKGLGIESYYRAVDILCGTTNLERLGEGFESVHDMTESVIVAASGETPKEVPTAVFLDDSDLDFAVDSQLQFQDKVTAFEGLEEAATNDVPVLPGLLANELANNAQDAVPETSEMAQKSDEKSMLSSVISQIKRIIENDEEPDEAACEKMLASVAKTTSETPHEPFEPVVFGANSKPFGGSETPFSGFESEKLTANDFFQVFPDCTDAFKPKIYSVDAGLLSSKRQDLIRSESERSGLKALLVRDTASIRWATAFDGVFDSERAHALMVTSEGSTLHTDSRYANALRTAAEGAGGSVAVNEERQTHAKFARSVLSSEGASTFEGKLGFEDSVTYEEFVSLFDEFGAESLLPTKDLMLGLRSVKDSSEIVRMKAAQAITDAAFDHILGFIRPGMTEREVQLELENFMLRSGAEGLAFSSIVATGANAADPHAIPGNTVIEAGQSLVLDFGAKAFGYCSDMTRTVFIGKPRALHVYAWNVLREANEEVEAMLRPGVTGKQAQELVERILAEAGFEGVMGHGLGHGVGLEVHEKPVLNSKNDTPLQSGNVVTVEPGIYLPGKFGMRLEDCGVVTSNGFEVFTQSTHEMVII